MKTCEVLHEYYSGESFVQSSSMEDNMAKSSSRQPGGSAAGIIGLLEVAESDFSRMLAEATAAEDSAISEFDTFSQDSKVSRASKEAESKNKAAERQRVQGTIQETGQDHGDAKKELAAVKEYDEKLKESCEAKAPSFEEREQRRKVCRNMMRSRRHDNHSVLRIVKYTRGHYEAVCWPQ